MMPDSNEQQNQNVIMRQLERLDERTRLMPTKDDINEIKRTMAPRDYLDGVIATQNYRITALETDMKTLQSAQLTRNDKTWLRLTQLASIAAVIGVIVDFMTKVRALP